MGAIGRFLQSENGEDNEIIQTVEMHYNENKYCDQYSPSGDDSPPLEDDRVALLDVEGTGNFASVGVLSKSQGAKAGEKIIYSRDTDGTVKAKIYLKNDGSIEIESESDTTLTLKGNITLKVDGDVSLEASNVTLTGNTKVTGGSFEVGGSVSPTGQGSLCGIPYCAFTGAPQCGNVAQGT